MRGTGSVMAADDGNAITPPALVTVVLIAVEALHVRVTLLRAVTAHVPAVAAVVLGDDQQEQAVHCEFCATDAAQQQPPRHMLVPQSNDDAQLSPGEKSMQLPTLGVQAEHPARAADGVQHVPPAHALDVQEELDVQTEPGDPAGTDDEEHGNAGASAQSEGYVAYRQEGHCDADVTHLPVSTHQYAMYGLPVHAEHVAAPVVLSAMGTT